MKEKRKIRSFANRLTLWIVLMMLLAMGLASWLIYDAIDEVKSTMQGMLDKVKKEIVTAEIEVKQESRRVSAIPTACMSSWSAWSVRTNTSAVAASPS